MIVPSKDEGICTLECRYLFNIHRRLIAIYEAGPSPWRGLNLFEIEHMVAWCINMFLFAERYWE